SAILYLLDEMPVRVNATGGSYIDQKIFDTTLTTCEFHSGVMAHIFVSWLHPFKEQKLVIVGSKKMAVFDDVQKDQKLVIYSHPTAVIDSNCEIGAGTKIWHFSHVMSKSRIGRNCNFGQNVVISPGVVIGDRVKIQNNVSVYTGVELEDDVFCGPSMVFTNVIN